MQLWRVYTELRVSDPEMESWVNTSQLWSWYLSEETTHQPCNSMLNTVKLSEYILWIRNQETGVNTTIRYSEPKLYNNLLRSIKIIVLSWTLMILTGWLWKVCIIFLVWMIIKFVSVKLCESEQWAVVDSKSVVRS